MIYVGDLVRWGGSGTDHIGVVILSYGEHNFAIHGEELGRVDVYWFGYEKIIKNPISLSVPTIFLESVI